MDQSERIKQCSKCENGKKHPNRGTLCGLTGQKPTFEESCENFIEKKKKHLSILTNESTNEKFDDRKKLKFAYQYDTMSKASKTAGNFLIIGTIALMVIVPIILLFTIFYSAISDNVDTIGINFGTLLIYIISSLFGLATIIVFVNISYQTTQIHKLLKKMYYKEDN